MRTLLNVPGLCFLFALIVVLVCAFFECTRTVFCIWPDDGSFELKHVTEFLILIYIHCCVIDWNMLLCYCNTQRDGSCEKKIFSL